MKVPNVEDKHMDRALDFVLKLPDNNSLKECVIKENPGMYEVLKGQLKVLKYNGESDEYIQAYLTGFYSCFFMIREAMKDEGLN
ncbi:MAG: hypothetical protein ACO3UU_06480 [Minisyncoccia bacterium]|jgi:hypothetical protein